jgi:dihydroxyacetone kinase-like protein
VTISRDAVIEWVKVFATLVAENKDYLTELDAAIGDADHGVNMHRGMQAALTKLPTVADKDIGTVLKTVGMTLVSTVGGASGPLYGTLFMQMGTSTANKMELNLSDWIAAIEAALNGVIARGKAQMGDKTIVDALTPALQALQEANAGGLTLPEALSKAQSAAEKGRDATIPLVAKKGRASYLGERSAGHQDPGATSMTLLMKAIAAVGSTTQPSGSAT